MPENIDQCPNACRNPACPYLTQINENTQVTLQTKLALLALLGEDFTGLNSGIINTILKKLDKLGTQEKVQKSWIDNAKPILYSLIAAGITALIEYGLLRGFN
jgi:hypothetical protein